MVSHIPPRNLVAGYYEDVLATIENPNVVLRGYRGTLIAIRNYGRRRYLMVVYQPSVCSAIDGFIITAYFTSKLDREPVASMILGKYSTMPTHCTRYPLAFSFSLHSFLGWTTIKRLMCCTLALNARPGRYGDDRQRSTPTLPP